MEDSLSLLWVSTLSTGSGSNQWTDSNFQQCSCLHSICSQRMPARSYDNAFSSLSAYEHWILACLFLWSLWRPPPSLNCCSSQKDSQCCWFRSCLNVDCKIRPARGYLWLRGLTWLQTWRDCQKWYRKDICSGNSVVGPHHCHLQLAFYSP